jgi:hypothetical protein
MTTCVCGIPSDTGLCVHFNHEPKSATEHATYSITVQQAFRDWNDNRAYLDNGRNYRVRPEPATPTHRPTGKIASWNKEVKRFHRAAQEWKERSELR